MDINQLYSILTRVAKPSQYLGNEINVIKKDFEQASVRVCLVFPDKYEMGMSHVGLRILYDILNQLPHVVCERAFAPEIDLEAELRKENFPLFSLESKRPLADFDIVGFSLTYELTYTNMVNIIDLGGIPVWQKDRKEGDPLIIAGGGCTMNAEPVADFLDAAVIGDGEEVILDIVEHVRKNKETKKDRSMLLDSLSSVEGIYIPSFFEPEYNDDGTLKPIKPLKEGYTKINKRVVENLDKAAYPTKLLVPSVKLIHDRIGIEIQRGCNRHCRFCQAGYIDRPVRQRSPETVLKIAEDSLRDTGIDEISLLSLSAADYACLVDVLKELNGRYAKDKVSISVPATRTEKLTPELIEQIKKVRKTGFTVAPEAGSTRMRRVINKGNEVDDLLRAVTNAFEAGWDLLKLYYMVGLPFEKQEDVLGIADEANTCIKICKKNTPRAELKLGVSSFVPKPHTPFQWEPQMTIAETKEKYGLVRHNVNDRRIRVTHHVPEMSYIEGLMSRGDRRVAKLIYIAFKDGCRFDEWEENFDFPKWQEAIKKWGGDPDFYLHRRRTKEEVLPWDHLFGQMEKEFLWRELDAAAEAAFTNDCSLGKCTNCGVCDFRKVKNRVYVMGEQEVMVKKGHREWYGWKGSEKQEAKSEKQEAGSKKQDLDSQGDGARTILRVRFSKTGDARFMGHLELMGVLKRAFKRLKVPVAFSNGFHPQMKLAMSYPLALGIESQWEYFDLELLSPFDPQKFKNELNLVLPGGVAILEVELIDKATPSLYSATSELVFEVGSNPCLPPQKIREAVEKFSTTHNFEWFRHRQGVQPKKLNLKSLVDVALNAETLSFKTKVSPDGSIKPSEVMEAIFGINSHDLGKLTLTKTGIRWKEASL